MNEYYEIKYSNPPTHMNPRSLNIKSAKINTEVEKGHRGCHAIAMGTQIKHYMSHVIAGRKKKTRTVKIKKDLESKKNPVPFIISRPFHKAIRIYKFRVR